MTESDVRKLMNAHEFKVLGMSYRATDDGKQYEFKMLIRTSCAENVAALAEDLRRTEHVITFDITPTGD